MNSATKQYANYVEHGIAGNSRFSLEHAINRDDSNYPYWLLRERLLSCGIELNTPDINAGRNIIFELHLNAMPRLQQIPAFVLLLETAQICPQNADENLLAQYERIFTWRDDWVDGARYVKINFPNRHRPNESIREQERNRFCCLIAGNRRPALSSPQDLYSERVKTIRWFERNAQNQLDLYGSGWEVLPARTGKIGRLWYRIAQKLARKTGYRAFPSYRGRVDSKFETLRKYRFAVCYENVKDLPGYITEKIFDCFFAGCVPVYWGADNVTDYIPQECFVDRRAYADHYELYEYLSTMTDAEFESRQSAIRKFLESSSATPFFAEHFVEKVTTQIVSTLEEMHGNLKVNKNLQSGELA
jgi:hypothetical protein